MQASTIKRKPVASETLVSQLARSSPVQRKAVERPEQGREISVLEEAPSFSANATAHEGTTPKENDSHPEGVGMWS